MFGGFDTRGAKLAIGMFLAASGAFAAEPMAPSDIQATFFNGQPFTASTPGAPNIKMIFTLDGKINHEPLAHL